MPATLIVMMCLVGLQLSEANGSIETLKNTVATLEEQKAKDHTIISSLRKSSANAERRADEAEAAMLALKSQTDDAVTQLTTVRVICAGMFVDVVLLVARSCVKAVAFCVV